MTDIERTLAFSERKMLNPTLASRKKVSALREDLEADFCGRVDGKVVL